MPNTFWRWQLGSGVARSQMDLLTIQYNTTILSGNETSCSAQKLIEPLVPVVLGLEHRGTWHKIIDIIVATAGVGDYNGT